MSKLRKFARGQTCTLRIEGHCNGNAETTVLAHLRGAGMAVKLNDHLAVHSCNGPGSCHEYIDSSPPDYWERVIPALYETLGRLRAKGLI